MIDERRTAPRWTRWVAASLLVASAATMAGACGRDEPAPGSAGPTTTATTTTTTTAGGTEPISEVLGRTPAPEAPGYEQYLLRVTLPPGIELGARHPSGLEVAYVEEGELAYTVIDGTARVSRDRGEGPTEDLVGPVDIVLRPGDTIYEWRETNHQAANRGPVPVVLLVASLVEAGQPLAVEE